MEETLDILKPYEAFVMQKLTMEAIDGLVKGNLLIAQYGRRRSGSGALVNRNRLRDTS
jgi:hypothetical protein